METNNGQPQRKPKRGAAGKQDLRLLFAAASVAVTLGGAGLLAAHEPAAALPSQPEATATPATQAAIQATEDGPMAAAPTATSLPADMPTVTIPQRQWPGPVTNSRSSR